MTYENNPTKKYEVQDEDILSCDNAKFPKDLTMTKVNELENDLTEYVGLKFSETEEGEGDDKITTRQVFGFRGVK
jgi:hypothetical protein